MSGAGSAIILGSRRPDLTNGNRLPLGNRPLLSSMVSLIFRCFEGLGEIDFERLPTEVVSPLTASSGETIPDGQQEMSIRYFNCCSARSPWRSGDVTKQAEGRRNQRPRRAPHLDPAG